MQVQTLEEEKEAGNTVMREKENEREELLISQSQVEEKAASLSSEMAEKEEYAVLQVSDVERIQRRRNTKRQLLLPSCKNFIPCVINKSILCIGFV